MEEYSELCSKFRHDLLQPNSSHHLEHMSLLNSAIMTNCIVSQIIWQAKIRFHKVICNKLRKRNILKLI